MDEVINLRNSVVDERVGGMGGGEERGGGGRWWEQ